MCHCHIHTHTHTHTLHFVMTTDCAVCSTGYSRSVGPSCSKCKGGRKAGILTAVVTAAAFAVLALIWLLYELLGIGDASDAYSTAASCNLAPLQVLAKLPWDKLRTPLMIFQILTQYIGITGLEVPLLYRDFLG
jgi:hypothetical protein